MYIQYIRFTNKKALAIIAVGHPTRFDENLKVTGRTAMNKERNKLQTRTFGKFKI